MSDDDKITKLQDVDRANKRDMILAEAITLFNDQGYYDTRLEDVAAKLHTSKTSISYHFKSKEALLFEAYSDTCDFAEAEIKLAASASTGLERIVRWIRAYAQAQSAAILGHRDPLAVISDPAALGDEDIDQITARLKVHSESLAQFIREGVADGSITIASPTAGVFLLLSMQQWIRRWLENVTPLSHDAAIDAVCDLLCYGLASDRNRVLKAAQPGTTFDTEEFLFDREARNKMKLEAFLRIGTRHLNRWGYRNLSVNDIAAELGVTRGVFYYHFDDKDALLNGCAQQTLQTMEKALKTYRHVGADGVSRLYLMLTALFEGHLTDLNPLLRLSQFSSLELTKKTLALARFRQVTAGISELIAYGMSDKSIRLLDVEAMEYLISGAIFGATRHRLKMFGVDVDQEPGVLSAANYFQPLFFGLAAR